jgi:hypothetical protein
MNTWLSGRVGFLSTYTSVWATPAADLAAA